MMRVLCVEVARAYPMVYDLRLRRIGYCLATRDAGLVDMLAIISNKTRGCVYFDAASWLSFVYALCQA